VTKGDLGVGTIVGSAVFNILAVGACCGLGAGLAVNKIRGEDGRVVSLSYFESVREVYRLFLYSHTPKGMAVKLHAHRVA